ncbi:MAG TPA: hypothetical protein VFZ91_07880 [Allosphingosinicella sp.]
MRLPGSLAIMAMVLAGCGRDDGAQPGPAAESGNSSPARAAAPPDAGTVPAARWDLQSSGEGVALALMSAPERSAIRLFCQAGQDRLLVNVPAFRPIASEERLSFGSGGEVVALVADGSGDRQRGGVSAAGAVPDDLAALIGGPVSASYGAQNSGPHPAPPQNLSRAFVAACREGAAGARPAVGAPSAPAGPCRMQDGKPLGAAPLRAIGTEPFWGARIEGRCVTYSHPEDQRGTRIWTRFTPAPDGGGTWSGALGGRRFELKTRAAPGCSDGMSDRRYPLAADLSVGGERRSGCAEPL